MMSDGLAFAALIGFACSNSLETALLTLSFAEEKKFVKSLGRRPLSAPLARFYTYMFAEWRKNPTYFLTVLLVFNAAFSMLWCVLGLTRFEEVPFTPLLVGVALFLFGELLPKLLARRFPDKVALLFLLPLYGPMVALRRVLSPLVRSFERLTNLHLPRSLAYPFTAKEIKMLLADPELNQDLRPRSRLILETMANFSSRRVKEAMRPAKDVFALDARQSDMKKIVALTAAAGYSRIPVSRDGTLDQTMGILYAKDILFTFATSGLLNLQDTLRDCPAVDENDRLGQVLRRFQREAIHIALVKDKSGKVKGIISLEDILENIVGDIRDEYK
ncbi:MAG: DUF21 domain-containing protein [Elusimicrobia bacterium]|nr:DUF21 domain-containing protein [Elusimicrobiota bacterium]